MTAILPQSGAQVLSLGQLPPVRMEVVEITSALAAEWLAVYAGPNRPINDGRVLQYQGDMEAGRWAFTADPIVISRTGKLLNGQHRLTAIANCVPAITLPCMVVFGVDDGAQMYMDQPQVRTVAQQLGLKGLPNSALSAAAAKLYLEWTRDRLYKSPSRGVTSKAEITEWALAHEDLLQTALATGYNKVDAPPSVVGAFALAIIQINPEKAFEFMGRLTSGADLAEGDPILALDRRLRNIRRSGVKVGVREYLAYFIRAWNAWLNGERLTKLQLPYNLSEDNFPELQAGSKVGA